MVGSQSFGPYGSVFQPLEYPEHDLIAFVARTEEWTQPRVIVASMAPGDTDGRELFSRVYDEVQFDNDHGDEDALVFFASGEGKLQRVTLDLARLRAEQAN